MNKQYATVYESMDALDAAGILYCHWKSNEHLEAGLNGETDVDMLVAKKDAQSCREILKSQGWLFDTAPPFTELEHWIGFDEGSGKLFHVHLHTAGLPVGPSKRKVFTLPQAVSDWILEGRLQQDGVWTAAPEAELFMLLLRISLKSTWRNLAGAYIRKRDVIPSQNLRRELAWLTERSDESAIVCPVLPKRFSEVIQNFLPVVNDKNSSIWSYLPVMLQARLMLLPYLTPSRLFAKRKRGGKTLKRPTPVFAFAGVDGSGKSTLVRELNKWLGWKMNVQTFYLGSPKKRGFGALLFRATRKFPSFKFLFNLYAAVYRLHTARKARQSAGRGQIVLTDRYPIRSLWGITDGPRLEGLLSTFEQYIYKVIPNPGCLVVLSVSMEVLRQRDPTLSDDTRLKKLQGIDRLSSQQGIAPVQVVDANREFGQVLLDSKRLIFRKLRSV